VKNDASLPVRAAAACLELGGLAAGDLDAVVFYEDPFARLERVLVELLRGFPRTMRQFPRALGAQLGSKIWVLDQLADALDLPRTRIETAGHHHSHAASAFFASPFERSAVVVADAVGEAESTTIWRGDGRELTCLGGIRYPHSLGLLYAALTAYLGFEVNEGEYKVMGLAAFGRPRLRGEFERLISIHDDGSFELALPYFAHMADVELGFGRRLEELLGPRRPGGRPWDLTRADDQRYADVAATLQAVTEEALLAVARRARAETGAAALCLAGGVALNAVANARLAREAGFERVFVQPAAGDAGGALGAAMLGAIARGAPRPRPLESAGLGLALDLGRAADLARELGLTVRTVSDPARAAAARICRGEVVAVAAGRFEWGPRALGQRSILAAPRPAGVRERINRAVKQREPFRPFAPAVLAERAADWFAAAPSDMTPFMTTVCPVLAGADLAAVTHVDGSARVQTVSRAAAPELHGILVEVARESDIPVVLNTSLNGRGEPIAATADDVLAFFLRHPIDAAFIGDLAVERRPA